MSLIESVLVPITLGAVLTCGLVAGLLFAFSNFVMRALGSIRASAGIAAMQAINVEVQNPVFFTVFFGAAVLSIVLACFALARWHHSSSVWLLTGATLYLTGGIVVTVLRNVPLNNALATVAASSPEAIALWRDYFAKWNRWNHVRTLATLLATAAFAIALCRHV